MFGLNGKSGASALVSLVIFAVVALIGFLIILAFIYGPGALWDKVSRLPEGIASELPVLEEPEFEAELVEVPSQLESSFDFLVKTFRQSKTFKNDRCLVVLPDLIDFDESSVLMESVAGVGTRFALLNRQGVQVKDEFVEGLFPCVVGGYGEGGADGFAHNFYLNHFEEGRELVHQPEFMSTSSLSWGSSENILVNDAWYISLNDGLSSFSTDDYVRLLFPSYGRAFFPRDRGHNLFYRGDSGHLCFMAWDSISGDCKSGSQKGLDNDCADDIFDRGLKTSIPLCYTHVLGEKEAELAVQEGAGLKNIPKYFVGSGEISSGLNNDFRELLKSLVQLSEDGDFKGVTDLSKCEWDEQGVIISDTCQPESIPGLRTHYNCFFRYFHRPYNFKPSTFGHHKIVVESVGSNADPELTVSIRDADDQVLAKNRQPIRLATAVVAGEASGESDDFGSTVVARNFLANRLGVPFYLWKAEFGAGAYGRAVPDCWHNDDCRPEFVRVDKIEIFASTEDRLNVKVFKEGQQAMFASIDKIFKRYFGSSDNFMSYGWLFKGGYGRDDTDNFKKQYVAFFPTYHDPGCETASWGVSDTCARKLFDDFIEENPGLYCQQQRR